MLKKGISHLPVVGHDGKLVGLVTAKDFSLHFVKPMERMCRAGKR
ncbi:MAG: CBS domain-containing protein [Nitrososphaerales archaeon]